MDLVRSILLQVEPADGALDAGQLDFGGHTQAEVYYHIELMQQRGLIDAAIRRDWNGTVISAAVSGLTWDGQDYLDSMRDDRVWARAKRAIGESVGSTTFEVVKRVCCEAAVRMALGALSP